MNDTSTTPDRMVSEDGTYPTVPLRKDRITVSVVQTEVHGAPGDNPDPALKDNLEYMLDSIDAANGYGENSPGAYNMQSAFVMEAVMTFFFLVVIIGATHPKAPPGFAGLAIGLALTLIHLISIPVTNTSVNPARSTGPAIFAGGAYLSQLWLFWVSPIVGAVLAGLLSRWFKQDED